MAKHSRRWYKEKNHQLKDNVFSSVDEHLETILSYAYDKINKWPMHEELWNEEYLTEIEQNFYDALVDTYAVIASGMEDIYEHLTPWSLKQLKNIYDLTFDKDQEKFDERVEHWWKRALLQLQQDTLSRREIKKQLAYEYDRLLRTESSVLMREIHKNKHPISLKSAIYIIEECTCDDCVNGEYSDPDEIPNWPFHPCCNANGYWIDTDDIDDIRDLDLEIDEVEKE